MSIFVKIDKYVTQRSLAIITLIISLIIVFNPILLPLRISYPTQGFIDRINALPAGSRMVWAGDMAISWYVNRRTGLGAVIDYIFSRGVKIIFFPGSEEASVYQQDLINYVKPKAKFGAEYGRDWVILQVLPGGEAALARVAANLKYSSVDLYGNPTADMPILKDVNTIGEIPLALVVTYGFTGHQDYMRQWAFTYKVPIIYICQFGLIAEYYGIYVFGNLDWISGLAEFEFATKRPAEEVINLDARNTIIYFLFAGIFIGSMAQWQRSRAVKKEVKEAP